MAGIDLVWPDKRKATNSPRLATADDLRLVERIGDGDGNRVIHGDNLLAMHALRDQPIDLINPRDDLRHVNVAVLIHDTKRVANRRGAYHEFAKQSRSPRGHGPRHVKPKTRILKNLCCALEQTDDTDQRRHPDVIVQQIPAQSHIVEKRRKVLSKRSGINANSVDDTGSNLSPLGGHFTHLPVREINEQQTREQSKQTYKCLKRAFETPSNIVAKVNYHVLRVKTFRPL